MVIARSEGMSDRVDELSRKSVVYGYAAVPAIGGEQQHWFLHTAKGE